MNVKKKWLCKILGYRKQEGEIQMEKEEIETLNEEQN